MKLGDQWADSLCASRIAADSTRDHRGGGLDWATDHATFDAKNGTISLEISATKPLGLNNFSFWSFASLSWTDEFQIVGLPPGPPITFQARLNTKGFGLNYYPIPQHFGIGSTEIGLRDAASNSASQMFAGDSLEKTIVLTITASPGQSFSLTLFAHGSAQSNFYTARTGADGLLVFGDLPAGAKVTSCGGYLDDAPVAARRSTWGALKLRYR